MPPRVADPPRAARAAQLRPPGPGRQRRRALPRPAAGHRPRRLGAALDRRRRRPAPAPGRVTGFTLTSPAIGWRSAPDRAGIGSDRRRLEVALGRLTRDGRALRAVLPLGTGRYADVRVTISRVRATQIAVDTLARDKLDRRGRALARKATRPAPARGDS